MLSRVGLDAATIRGKNCLDKGTDGCVYVHDHPGGKIKQIGFSVKAGHLGPAFVRDLEAVLDREKDQIGVLLSLDEHTSGVRVEAAGFGFYDPRGVRGTLSSKC